MFEIRSREQPFQIHNTALTVSIKIFSGVAKQLFPPDLEAKALDLLVPGVEHLPRLEMNGRINLVDVALKMSLRLCLCLRISTF
jgi:hypothetical protein